MIRFFAPAALTLALLLTPTASRAETREDLLAMFCPKNVYVERERGEAVMLIGSLDKPIDPGFAHQETSIRFAGVIDLHAIVAKGAPSSWKSAGGGVNAQIPRIETCLQLVDTFEI